MAITATYKVYGYGASLGSYQSRVLAGIDAALASLSSVLAGDAKLQIAVTAFSENSTTLAGAEPSSYLYVGATGGKYIYDTSLAYQLRTGIDKNGSADDIDIYINTQKFERFFFDSSPWDSGDIPGDRIDFISTMVHEILHGLGFTGNINADTGKPYNSARTVFDEFVSYSNGQPYFTGENARSYYGGNVPLDRESVYHLGNLNGVGSDLNNELMAAYAQQGVRDVISPLEKAIMADLGIGTNQSDSLRVHFEPTSQSVTLRAGYGTDTAVYAGSRSEYTVTYSAGSGGYIVKGRGYTDTLISVERMKIGNDFYWIEDLAGLTRGVHRFYNKDTGTHFMTGSNQEAYQLRMNAANMEDEGMAFATASSTASSLEVFRFLNKATGAYFYTISVDERNNIQKTLASYEYQGSSFRAYTKDSGPQEELYRFFNTATGSHFFTTSEAERDTIIGSLPTYKYEGIGFYVDVLS